MLEIFNSKNINRVGTLYRVTFISQSVGAKFLKNNSYVDFIGGIACNILRYCKRFRTC